MPKSAYYTLTWSSSHQAYELYEGQGDDALDLIPDSLAWLVWVSQVSSFAFHGQHGSCTVRKERKRRRPRSKQEPQLRRGLLPPRGWERAWCWAT